ncbi:MAG: hypothetical protein ACFE91_05150 [Promethearchaeota archaeon]
MNVKAGHNKAKSQEENSQSKNIITPEKSTKEEKVDLELENLCDENIITLQKIHAILLNCSNLSKKQKLEFCESERYFMKLYLRKLKDQKD